MKKLICALLILFFPVSAISQETGYYFFLQKGHQAPYDGILLDREATAKVLARAKLCGDECNLKLRFQEDDFKLLLSKEIDILQIRLIQKENTHKKQMDLKEKELSELRSIALNTGIDWTSFALGAGIGAAAIAAAVVGIFIAGNK